MKQKINLILGFLLFSLCIYGQEKPVYAGIKIEQNAENIPAYKLTPEWKKHKKCQAWGWTTLGVGSAMMMYGFWGMAMERDDVAKSTPKYAALAYTGIAVTAASVPLFVFSIKNKKKARSLCLGSNALAAPCETARGWHIRAGCRSELVFSILGA